jgi:hypothetical protein
MSTGALVVILLAVVLIAFLLGFMEHRWSSH